MNSNEAILMGLFLLIFGVKFATTSDKTANSTLIDIAISLFISLGIHLLLGQLPAYQAAIITPDATPAGNGGATSKTPGENSPSISSIGIIMGLAGGLIAMWTTLVWNATRDAAKELRSARNDLDSKYSEINEKKSKLLNIASNAVNTANLAQAKIELLSDISADEPNSQSHRFRTEILAIFNHQNPDSIAMYLSAIAENRDFIPFLTRTIWQAIEALPDFHPEHEGIRKAVQNLKWAAGR